MFTCSSRIAGFEIERKRKNVFAAKSPLIHSHYLDYLHFNQINVVFIFCEYVNREYPRTIEAKRMLRHRGYATLKSEFFSDEMTDNFYYIGA